MKLHYYGRLDSLESCYTFQEFEVEGLKIYLQNSTRFGYEPSTMAIKDPALFVENDGVFHRYVVEGLTLKVIEGRIENGSQTIDEIMKKEMLSQYNGH